MDNSREVDVISSTQWQSQLQKDLAIVLGVAQNKVHVRTKRLGGGFGGKETGGHVGAACCAVAAVKFNRPVRIALERDEDMMHTGTRHPSQFKYKIGFNKDGKVISYKSKFMINPNRNFFDPADDVILGNISWKHNYLGNISWVNKFGRTIINFETEIYFETLIWKHHFLLENSLSDLKTKISTRKH